VSISVICATGGRPTLDRALQSATSQLESGDELLVCRLDCHWGHEARDQAMPRALGTHLMFLDDDDAYVAGALVNVRGVLEREPDRVHIFRMLYPDGRVIWSSPTVACGNISTIMLVVPNVPGKLGSWGSSYEGDFQFLSETLALRAEEPIFHEDVIGLVRPA
jgi:hypothetical protein